MWEEKSSFKNTPRDFTQVFRGKITNTEVESTVGEKRYFMGGGACVQRQQLWESGCGGHPDPAFIPPQWEEWFTISRPRTGFWVNTHHIVQSLRKSQAPIFPMRTHLPGWTAVPCHHLAARDKSDTQISPSPLCLLHSGNSLHWCHHFQHLSYQASPPSSLGHPHLLVHSTTSPCILLYHWWHLASEKDQIVLQWVHFIFISRTAAWNICT